MEVPVNGPFDAELGSALMRFSDEATLFCDGISTQAERGYAVSYARMLQQRARGLEFEQPRPPHGMFGPSGSLIRSALDKMSVKHFSKS